MGTLVMLSIGVRLLAVFWCLLLLGRVRDWRLRFLMLTLALMATYQIPVSVKDQWNWVVAGLSNLGEWTQLVMGVLLLLSVFVMELDIRKRRGTEVRLRVLDQPLFRMPAQSVFSLLAKLGRPVSR